MTPRLERLSKEIYIVLRRIWLSELNEKIYSLLGINHIKINRNLSTVIIYLDLEMIDKKQYSKKKIILKLQKLSPFLKHRLVEKLKLPIYCKLIFEEDTFIHQARRVEELIASEK